MNKLGRCHNLGPELIPWGKFSRQPVVLGLVIHVILFTSRTWQNSLVEALSLWKNLCSWKNQKQKKVLGKKRLVLVPRGAPRLRPDFERRGRLQTKFAIHNVENEVPFIYVNTRLDKNRNFESFRSVRCLAPQHIFRFFSFLPRILSSCLTLHSAIEIKKGMRRFRYSTDTPNCVIAVFRSQLKWSYADCRLVCF